jgi:hypothetical protein
MDNFDCLLCIILRSKYKLILKFSSLCKRFNTIPRLWEKICEHQFPEKYFYFTFWFDKENYLANSISRRKNRNTFTILYYCTPDEDFVDMNTPKKFRLTELFELNHLL